MGRRLIISLGCPTLKILLFHSVLAFLEEEIVGIKVTLV